MQSCAQMEGPLATVLPVWTWKWMGTASACTSRSLVLPNGFLSYWPHFPGASTAAAHPVSAAGRRLGRGWGRAPLVVGLEEVGSSHMSRGYWNFVGADSVQPGGAALVAPETLPWPGRCRRFPRMWQGPGSCSPPPLLLPPEHSEWETSARFLFLGRSPPEFPP